MISLPSASGLAGARHVNLRPARAAVAGPLRPLTRPLRMVRSDAAASLPADSSAGVVTTLDATGHALSIGIAASMAAKFYNGSLFSWHPTLMALGFVAFMAIGIMRAIDFRKVGGQARVAAIFIHGFLQTAAMACISLGFAAIFQNKIINGKAHFVSQHGKLGLAATVLAALVAIGGAFAFKKFKLIDMFPTAMQPVIKERHRQLGTVTLLLAIVVTFMGISYPHMARGAFTPAWQAGLVGLAGVILGKSYVQRIQRPAKK